MLSLKILHFDEVQLSVLLFFIVYAFSVMSEISLPNAKL